MKNYGTNGIRIRAREYNGPSPHSVAILARNPSKTPLDNLIIQNRKKDDQLAAAVERTEEHRKVELKMQWETMTTKKILGNTIKRSVRSKLNQHQITLEERRQELRQLLASEEQGYIQQAHSMKETMEQKQERMRTKAVELKSIREAERLKVVQQKLDQQWQNQCEELRSVLTRRHQDQVCLERQHQLYLNAEMERERQAEEAMYAELWERDRLAKAAREEREAREAMERNYRVLETLQSQREHKATQKTAIKDRVRVEAEQLRTDRQQLEAELQKARDNDTTEKNHYRKSLEKQIKVRSVGMGRDKEEELAMDIQMLNKAASEEDKSAEEEARKRINRRQEESKYRKYLAEQKILEKERESEIEKIIQSDAEWLNNKKLMERRKKREAREAYLREVMEVRSVQVQDKEKEREMEKAETAQERKRINDIIRQHASYQKSQEEYVRNKNRSYSRDLLCQVEHETNIRHQQRLLDQHEYENGLQTEQAYEARLREVLERRDIQQGHPLRQLASKNDQQNTLIFK